ncbi:MAG: hypothetical protein ACOYZ7_20095 [Chloroflexota bacterium]
MRPESEPIVRASEIGLYAYCARAWWLGKVQGHPPTNRTALEAGEAAHQAHGRTVTYYHRLRQAALLLLGLAMLVLTALLATALLR